MPSACQSRDEVLLPFPPDMVWRALVDLAAYPVWWPLHVEVRVVAIKPGLVGSQVEISPRGGVRFVCEVEQLAPLSQMRMDYVAGIFHGTGIWRLEPAEGGTRLSYSVDIGFRNRILSLISSLVDVRSIHIRLMRNIFQGLRDHLERQPQRFSPPVASPALRSGLHVSA